MNYGNFKHGYTYKDRLYRIWHNMKGRCYNPKNKKYVYYGGKNITVCDEWKNDFIKFKNWALNNGYQDNLTIDRIDSNKSYYPENCQWVTLSENTIRSNDKNKTYKAISPNGKEFIIHEYANFCKKHNLNKGNVCRMINHKGIKHVNGWKIIEIN